ncbi:hypothetical protein C8R44DRAFT_862145 [Mycena epipterygia]|nr:hypothetical protein C8R44DRAFT_862145 [Mycena epipterygia]
MVGYVSVWLLMSAELGTESESAVERHTLHMTAFSELCRSTCSGWNNRSTAEVPTAYCVRASPVGDLEFRACRTLIGLVKTIILFSVERTVSRDEAGYSATRESLASQRRTSHGTGHVISIPEDIRAEPVDDGMLQ